MSSLRGEEALKDGISLEFTWTVRHFLEVMDERADWIRLGGLPGESGVDFILGIGDREEHHQVKRAFGSRSEWTMANLDAQDVLSDFKNRSMDPNARCHFVSTIPAVQLGYLAERARRSENSALFKEHYITGDYKAWYQELLKRWALDEQDCWERLQRISTRHADEKEVESSCLHILKYLVDGDAVDAHTHLRDFCFTHLHKKVRSSDLWNWLATKGVRRSPYFGDHRVIERLERQTRSYVDGIRDKLIQPPLPRKIATDIVEVMAASEMGEDIVVLGSPGGGKSAVMMQIVELCQEKRWPVLAFRLDDLPASLTTSQLQENLGLTIPPARAVAFAAAGDHVVVVIDQLDAVSEYSGRTGNLFLRASELIQELRGYRYHMSIHLVIACREVDWKHDGRLKKLHCNQKESEADKGIYKVEPLSDGEIAALLSSNGMDAASFSPQQHQQLLRIPQYLAVLIETHPSDEELPKIITPKKLFDAYWDKKQSDMAKNFPQWEANFWHQILSNITEKLSKVALAIAPSAHSDSVDAPLAVSAKSLQSFSPLAINWMLTNGVLTKGKDTIRFGHESFFDYCFARFFDERGETLLTYLLRSDQTLIQRGQLRQVMAYLRDENLGEYLDEAQRILEAKYVRAHLKQLLVAVLCDVQDPSIQEWEILRLYLEQSLIDFDSGNRGTWARHVFDAFSVSLPLFKVSVSSGAFTNWLQNAGAMSVGMLFRVLNKHQNVEQETVWQIIAPLRENSKFDTALDFLARFSKAGNSRETFDWLLAEARENFDRHNQQQEYQERFHTLLEDLAKNQPAWLAEWIAVYIQARVASWGDQEYELIKHHTIDSEQIGASASANPVEFVSHIVPEIMKVPDSWHLWIQDEKGDEESGYISPDQVLSSSLVRALQKMVKTHHEEAREWLMQLRSSSSDGCHTIYAGVLCGEGAEFTALAIDFLSRDEEAFFLTYGDKLIARVILQNHAKRFSKEELMSVESAILSCYPKREMHGRHPDDQIKRCLGNWRGYQQMILLRSFPRELLSNQGSRKSDEWERKFDSVRRYFVESYKSKPINKVALGEWGPADYYEALVTRKARLANAPRRYEFGHETGFGDLLIDAIKRNPGVFVEYLSACDGMTNEGFLESLAHGLASSDLKIEMAEKAAMEFHRLGEKWAMDVLRLLQKVPSEHLSDTAFLILMQHAIEGALPPLTSSQPEEGRRAEHLLGQASNSVRGRALEVLRVKLWEDPSIVSRIAHHLPAMMRDPNAVIRAELASICYAVAYATQHRRFSVELFVILATENLPDPHVLAGQWSIRFIRASLRDHWSTLRPILENMLASEFSEVRRAGTHLVCIAVVSGLNAVDIASKLVNSTDPKVRAKCAEIASHNLDIEANRSWTIKTFLTLANDPDLDVCRAIGSGLYHSQKRAPLDFNQLEDVLKKFVTTRAFTRAPSNLIEAISDSRSVLPHVVFDIIQSLINRLDEPVEDHADRLSFHIATASRVIKRLYHENRDGILRRHALDLIDELCLRGEVDSSTLDQWK
ncbi:hypothetical protein [Prosthecobacter debontii]|nr:hypothetical protein [Prosthecobacter debontii]